MNTYDKLQASIKNFMGRDDLDHMIPDFIRLAEVTLNNNGSFRVRDMVCKLKVDLTADELGLPPDYLGLRVMRYEKGEVLRLLTPESFAVECRDGYVDLGNRFEIRPAGTLLHPIKLEIFYYQMIPELSDTRQTNWLTNINPNIYLYGALLEATEFVRDDARIQLWASRYKDAVEGLIQADKQSRWPGLLQVQNVL